MDFQTHHNLVHIARRSNNTLGSHEGLRFTHKNMQDHHHLHHHSFHWLPPYSCVMKFLANHCPTCEWIVPSKFFVISDQLGWYAWRSKCNSVVIDQLGKYYDLLVVVCGNASKVGLLEWREQVAANNVCSYHIQILEPTFVSTCIDVITMSTCWVSSN